jgi:hypothetical protein
MSGGQGKPASIGGIGPATHSQPGGSSSGQVGPVDHPAHGPDPALASWAQFSLGIGVTPLHGADAKMIKRHGKHLNELIARKAAEFGWIYVDVEKEFEGYGYCSQKPFWRTAKLSCHLQGDFEGTMHPNEDGVKAWAKKYASAIREHTLSTRATEPNLLR